MTRKSFISTSICMLAAGLVFLFAAASSHQPLWHGQAYAQADGGDDTAQSQPQDNDNLMTRGPDGKQKRCREIDEAKGGVLIGYIVPCIIYTIKNTTVDLSQKMVDWLMPTVWAFITFVIVMFGIKVVSGEGQIHQQALLLLLKIAVVVTLLGMIPTYVVPHFYDFMSEAVTVVSGTIGDANTSIHCDVKKYGDGQTLMIWKQMDCLLGKLYGFAMGDNGKPSMLLVASVFGLLSGFLFGGTFGVIVFFACIGVLWSMLMLIMRTAFTFLQSYLYASLLFLIAPLFMPLILLKASTYYFEAWWKGILACILLPTIITAYAMFAMILYDDILFAPNAKINKLFEYKFVQDAAREPKQACDSMNGGNTDMRSAISGIEQKVLYDNPFMKHFANPGTGAFGNMCAGMNLPIFKAEKTDPAFKDARDALIHFFTDAIKLFVVAWLVNAGFENVKSFASNIIGSPSVGASVMQPSKSEQKMIAGFQGLKQGLSAGFGGEAGTGFLKNMPRALKYGFIGDQDAGVAGFLGSVSRSTTMGD